MTRIDCVPIPELEPVHVRSNYRELPRVRNLYPRRIVNIPPTYRMSTGHVLFFLDKGVWLKRRYEKLAQKMLELGYKTPYLTLDLSHWPEKAMNDWNPTPDELKIDRKRINERLKHMKKRS